MHGIGRIPDEVGHLILSEDGAVIAVSFQSTQLQMIIPSSHAQFNSKNTPLLFLSPSSLTLITE